VAVVEEEKKNEMELNVTSEDDGSPKRK